MAKKDKTEAQSDKQTATALPEYSKSYSCDGNEVQLIFKKTGIMPKSKYKDSETRHWVYEYDKSKEELGL